MDTFLPHVGFVRFPRGPKDLGSAVCPACFAPRDASVCASCGLDLASPHTPDLDNASMDAAAALDRRLELIGRIRAASLSAIATAAVSAATDSAATAAVMPVPAALSTKPAPEPPGPAFAPDVAPGAEPRRHLGVQVILLIVGVSLLAVGAIFFLVYAFLTFGLIWRSVIIASVTLAAAVGSTLLMKRRLRATAEAISVLAIVFVYLDVFAVRANDLFGSQQADGLVYWGVAILASAPVFIVWSRVASLRLPSVVAGLAAPLGLALLVGGATAPLDDPARRFAAFCALAVGGLIHLASRGRVQRWASLVLAIIGLVLASITAITLPGILAAPALGLALVAAIALIHTVVIIRGTAARGFGHIIAALGAVAAAGALVPVATRVADDGFAYLWPQLTATAVALTLHIILTRLQPGPARSSTRVAEWSAAAVAALTLVLPVGAAVGAGLTAAVAGSPRWSMPGSAVLEAGAIAAQSVASLWVVIALVLGAWVVSGVLRRRLAGFVGAAGTVLVFSVPLVGTLWMLVAGWLLVSAAGVALLVVGRTPRARMPVRAMPVRVVLVSVVGLALLFAYSSSWASIDTWWIGSLGVIAVLLASRIAISAPRPRAASIGVSAVVAVVAAAAEGWHINERFAFGFGALTESLHTAALLATVLIALSVALRRRASASEVRVLFWVATASAIVITALDWLLATQRPALSGTIVMLQDASEPVLGLALVAALVAAVWRFRAMTNFVVERTTAAILIAPASAWMLDSLRRAVTGSALPESIGLDGTDGMIALSCVVAGLVVAIVALAVRSARSEGIVLDVSVPDVRPAPTPDGMLSTRVSLEAGVGAVTVPAIFAVAIAGSELTWLVLILSAFTALIFAVSQDGIIGSTSARRYLGWLAVALGTASLWTQLARTGVSAPEAWVLPLAGAIAVITVLVERTARHRGIRSRVAPLLWFSSLCIAILPVAIASVDGPLTRAIIITVASATLLIGASIPTRSDRLREWLDVTAIAAGGGVLVAGFGRPLVTVSQGGAADAALDVSVAVTLIVVLVAALAQGRLARALSHPRRTTIASGSLLIAVVAALVIETATFSDTAVPAALATTRAGITLVFFAALHVAALALRRPPLSRPVGWSALAGASIIALTAVVAGAIDPLEWATVTIGLSLVVTGVIQLRAHPAARSWPWLAPGILVLLFPTLVATFVDAPLWRLVGLGIACIACVVAGGLLRLQAPLLVGSAIILVHVGRTFSPQIVAVYQLTEWWVWAVIGGAVILFIALTLEKRIRDLRSASTSVVSLR